MYQNIYHNKPDNTIHLWDDNGKYINFPYKKYAFRKKKCGKYKSLFGDELEKIYAFDERDTDLFESDVPIEQKVLMDAYPDSEEPSNNHRIVVLDIETDSDGGFPKVDEGNKKITAIALYDQTGNKYYCFILDPEGKVSNQSHDNVEILPFKEEEELIHSFLNRWDEIRPTIVTGWNTNGFDIPYLYNRITNFIDKKESYKLSPIRIVYKNKFTKKITLAGISCLDYIDLYKKFLGVMKPSYTLGAVAKDEELKAQKITYKGNLNDLYKNDIHRFVEYNLADVKVVVELDKKYDFIFLARSVCHKGRCPYEWFQMSSRFIDGAILVYLHSKGMIGPNKPVGGREEYEEMVREGEEGFTGAYVKDPIPGIYDWVYSADIRSLYPSVIMSLNISNETKVGKIPNWNYYDFISGNLLIITIGEKSYRASEFKELIANNKYSISTNGVLYDQSNKGVVPIILDKWFTERLEYKALEKKYKKEDPEKSSFYNRRQQRQKIFLNSVYGILSLPLSRWYDVDNAEATTLSGQTIIKSAEKLVDDVYSKKIGNKDKNVEQIIYIDTDAIYSSSVPLAKCEDVYPLDMKKYTIEVATEISNSINEFYKSVVPRVFNISPENNRIMIVADVISEKSLWIAKKRYAMLKVFDMENMMDVKDKKGNPGKIEFKGIDVVRSSFPTSFRKLASEILDMILRSKPNEEINEKILKFEENIESIPVFDMGRGTSVKYVSQKGDADYNPSTRKIFSFVSKTPIGVKAALSHNDLLKIWNLTDKIQPIYHGQKIKWVYLLQNEYGIDSLAFKNDDTDPDKIIDFINDHIDRKRGYENELKNKLEEIYNIIGWQYPNRGTKVSFDFFGGADSGNDW